MSKLSMIRSYDYVNHPYEQVREALNADATSIFQSATHAAAKRSRSLASGLSVTIAGIEIGTEISIKVSPIDEDTNEVNSSPKSTLQLKWEATKMSQFFPLMNANLVIYPLTKTETQLDFQGNYEPPFGAVGNMIDALVGKRIAEACVHGFLQNVAAYLREELARTSS